jgi:hypothetical protein
VLEDGDTQGSRTVNHSLQHFVTAELESFEWNERLRTFCLFSDKVRFMMYVSINLTYSDVYLG